MQPEELVRVSLSLDDATAELPDTLLAADFSGLLPDGMEGSVRLDTPQFGGQIVFGLDTSSSPFYILTRPDALTTNHSSLESVVFGHPEEATEAGELATELTVRFGVAAKFKSDTDLLDGILSVPSAEGFLTSEVAVDFSRRGGRDRQAAAAPIGRTGQPASQLRRQPHRFVPSDRCCGNYAARSASRHQWNDNPLANIEVVGSIHKPSSQRDTATNATDQPWQFQLRTADLFVLPDDIQQRLPVATVDDPNTPTIELDDAFDQGAGNDDWASITRGHVADLGTPSGRLTIGGQDPASSTDLLALNDQADWFRFDITAIGNATSFVQIDFAGHRGDLDLAVYRATVDEQGNATEVQKIRSDDLSFGDSARVSLLGESAGTYFVQVFADGDQRNPFYALTIDPPGRLDAGIEGAIGDFAVRDVALEINVDSNFEFSGFLGGRMVMTFGTQEDVPADGQPTEVPVELAFRATIDTVADDADDNGGFQRS